MYCTACAWRFSAGGVETKKQIRQIEKDERLIHQLKHKQARRPGDPNEVLQVEHDYHAAEIGSFYTEVNDNPTVASTTYGDVLTVASSNFTASQDHLVIVTAHIHNNTANECTGIRVVRGTTPTVIVDSEAVLESPSSTDLTLRQLYSWWGIVNTNPAEQLKVQIKSTGAGTAAADFITCTVIKLSPDLVAGTDYIAPAVVTAQTAFSAFDTDTTSNNATTGSFTPASANHRWLILGKARYGAGLSGLTSVQSRLERAGTTTNSHPQAQQEGEDTTADYIVLVTARVDTLAASAHTYTEISKLVETGGGTGVVNSSRQNSGIFALDLDSFKNVSTILQQDNSLGQPNTSTTAYADQVATTSITTNQIGNVLVMGYVTWDPATSSNYPKFRMQINNTDPQDLPTTTTNDYTTKAYNLSSWTAEDMVPYLFCHRENLSAATHTIDIDGSVTATGTSRGTVNRTIVAFSMEMSQAALTQVRPESVGINEGIVYFKGKQLTKVVSESEGIVESGNKSSGTTSNYITPSNFQLRGSGTSNLGGAMSATVAPSRLFDNVSIAEVAGGDPTPDHRCFYIYNSHSSLTMKELRIWFADNTQGDDHIQMGLGNSAIGTATVETEIANEGAAPSPAVTFVDAPSRDNGLVIGDIPPLNHKAIWLRRTVPAGIPSPVFNNRYTIMSEFITDHV